MDLGTIKPPKKVAFCLNHPSGIFYVEFFLTAHPTSLLPALLIFRFDHEGFLH